MKQILLTGFEPFQKESLNSSQELVQAFAGRKNLGTLILPVAYQKTGSVIRAEMAETDYDFILMFGQAGGRKCIELERVAINLEDSDKADEEGELRTQHKISARGPDAFLNPLPLRDWTQYLQKKNHPVEISFSAGAFVCNSLYYQVFEMLKTNRSQVQALFVHLPYLPEQLPGKSEGTPSLPLTAMKAAVEDLLLLINEKI